MTDYIQVLTPSCKSCIKSAVYTLIYTDAGLHALVDRLSHAGRIALDTEADSLHHYRAKVCLIQVSHGGRNYIIDPLVTINLSPLLKLLTHKQLIIHGADFDLRMLRESFTFRPAGEVFDTMLAAKLLGYREVGLVSLVRHHFGAHLTKRGQKSDWSRRPLTQEQLTYASDDTRFLEDLAERLRNELRAKGREEWHRESCALMVNATAHDNPRDAECEWRIKGSGKLRGLELALLKQLWHWREKEAQRADVPPFKIMNNSQLIEIAIAVAQQPDRATVSGIRLPANRRNSLDQTIKGTLEIPPLHWPQCLIKPRIRKALPLIRELRNACSRLAHKLGIDPHVIASKATLESIAQKGPRTIKGIMAAGPTMRWQATLLKPIIDTVYG